MSILIALALLGATAPENPQVATANGPLKGRETEDGSVMFNAVPYAAPPVGALRWRAPQPVTSWSSPRDATRPAPACSQPDYGWNSADLTNGTAEDCLYLDIRTPDIAGKAPVMIWIHGGNATVGSSARYVESSIHKNNIVLVSIQYRLGALGWMAHPALSAEQGGASGNYGLLDVQAALRWVRANIAKFGGDPDNVTLFGNSAGAQIIQLTMQSPEARGLFHKAILQSGSSNFHYRTRTLAAGEAQGLAVIAAAGGNPSGDADALRSIPVAALIDAGEKAPVPDQPDRYGIFLAPLVDGRVITRDPLALRAEGRAVSVPVIVGTGAKEEVIFDGADAQRAAIRSYFGSKAEEAIARYGLDKGKTPKSDPRLGDIGMQVSTDILYRCVSNAIARSAVQGGFPAWQYHYDYGDAVTHGGELGTLFGWEDKHGSPPLTHYWAHFARWGDPNVPGLTEWPSYTHGERAYLAFTDAGPVVRTRLREAECDGFTG